MKYYNALVAYLIEIGIALKQSGAVALVVGLFGTAVMSVSQTVSLWVTQNIGYITIVTGAIAIDHLLGTLVHAYWKKDFSWLKNIGGFAIKLLLVVCLGLLFEGLSHLTIEEDFLYTYLKMVCRIMVFCYPFRSVCLNAAIMTNGKFPPVALINKIAGFNKTLDINQFKQNNDGPGNPETN